MGVLHAGVGTNHGGPHPARADVDDEHPLGGTHDENPRSTRFPVPRTVAAGALRLPSLHGTSLVIRRKLGAYLARRGYEAEVVDEACARLLGQASADEADDQAAGAGTGGS